MSFVQFLSISEAIPFGYEISQNMDIGPGTEEVIEPESYPRLSGQDLIGIEDFAQSGEGCPFYLGRQEQSPEGKHLQLPEVHSL